MQTDSRSKTSSTGLPCARSWVGNRLVQDDTRGLHSGVRCRLLKQFAWNKPACMLSSFFSGDKYTYGQRGLEVGLVGL